MHKVLKAVLKTAFKARRLDYARLLVSTEVLPKGAVDVIYDTVGEAGTGDRAVALLREGAPFPLLQVTLTQKRCTKYTESFMCLSLLLITHVQYPCFAVELEPSSRMIARNPRLSFTSVCAMFRVCRVPKNPGGAVFGRPFCRRFLRGFASVFTVFRVGRMPQTPQKCSVSARQEVFGLD